MSHPGKLHSVQLQAEWARNDIDMSVPSPKHGQPNEARLSSRKEVMDEPAPRKKPRVCNIKRLLCPNISYL